MKTIVLLLGGMIFWYSCRKPSCARSFEFHFPATITAGDTFAIGDTLWMSMDLPNELVDHQTGELIDLSQFDLYMALGLSRLDVMYVTSAVNDFKLIEDIGTITKHNESEFVDIYVHFKKLDEKKYRIGLVIKKSGVYMMSLGLPIRRYLVLEESEDSRNWLKVTESSCRQSIIEHSGTRFEGGCVNYYLMEQYRCQQSSPTDTLINCLRDSVFMAHRGGHAFVVK